MTRLRGMVAWLATEVEQVPSEETSLQELERTMSHRHARVPVVVCVGDSTKENVETSSADKIETSSPADNRTSGTPGPQVPQNIQSILSIPSNLEFQTRSKHFKQPRIPSKFQAVQTTLNYKQIPSIPSNTEFQSNSNIPSNPEFQANSKHSKQPRIPSKLQAFHANS